jgi:hypothetical protein
LAVELGGGRLTIVVSWKVLISISFGLNIGLNVGFPLVEGIRVLDGLKEIDVLWPANYWTVLRKLA